MARRVLHDRFFLQAKREGYLARSAYKLTELHERKKLFLPGDAVLDLGCAPGAWLQVASEIVGPEGIVVGVDLKPVEARIAPNVLTLVGDLTLLTPEQLTAPLQPSEPPEAGPAPPPGPAPRAPRRYDVVMSDMAPNTMGGAGGSIDHFRSVRLCEAVLDRLPGVLRPGGATVMKVFEGEAFAELLKRTKRVFRDAGAIKPSASRDVSRETYLFGFNYRGERPAHASPAAAPRKGPPA